jgi:hypothetical protein
VAQVYILQIQPRIGTTLENMISSDITQINSNQPFSTLRSILIDDCDKRLFVLARRLTFDSSSQ